MADDHTAYLAWLLGADWEALFVMAYAVVEPGSAWRQWEVARERAVHVAEEQRPDMAWTEERRTRVRQAWTEWQRVEQERTAVDPDAGSAGDPGPRSVLRALLGQEWRTLLLTVGASHLVPAGRLPTASQRVVRLAQEVRPDLRWSDGLREQVRRAWLAWWAEEEQRPEPR